MKENYCIKFDPILHAKAVEYAYQNRMNFGSLLAYLVEKELAKANKKKSRQAAPPLAPEQKQVDGKKSLDIMGDLLE